jgi:hypothetical protein
MCPDAQPPAVLSCENCACPTLDADILCPHCWTALHDAARIPLPEQAPAIRGLAVRITHRLQSHLSARALEIAAEFREGTEAAKAMADALDIVAQELPPNTKAAPALVVLASGAREWAEHAQRLLAQLDSHTRNVLAQSYATDILKVWQ